MPPSSLGVPELRELWQLRDENWRLTQLVPFAFGYAYVTEPHGYTIELSLLAGRGSTTGSVRRNG